MNNPQINAAIRKALWIADVVSPTSKERRGFTRLVYTAYVDGAGQTRILRELLSAILDGMQHGNWPRDE